MTDILDSKVMANYSVTFGWGVGLFEILAKGTEK